MIQGDGGRGAVAVVSGAIGGGYRLALTRGRSLKLVRVLLDLLRVELSHGEARRTRVSSRLDRPVGSASPG